MIRKLAIALSLLGACFTGFVYALGLGEVTVKSALNQPLNAEIELVNTSGLSLNEILPGLATREEFQKANVDRVYFLSDLRFEVKPGSQGKAVIVLTSKKPVREPYLNFIVELIWPSGRLLREYALLIDPPVFTEQPIAKVNTPSTARVSQGDQLSIATAVSAPKSRPILTPVSQIETGTYGATTASDTLWEIAIKARPNRSVSPQQVMLAIQDLNPEAFIDNNINKLKAGQVLRLPSLDQINQRTQQQAIVGVISQNEALTGKRTQSVIDGSQSSQKNSSQIASTTTSKQTTGDQLKLVVSEKSSSSASNTANSGQSNTSGGGNSNELAITLEKLDKANIENKELNSRLNDLEEQLTTLQRLLTLKNDQLSSIQSQMRASEIEKLKNNEISTESDVNEQVTDTVTDVAVKEETSSVATPSIEATESVEEKQTNSSESVSSISVDTDAVQTKEEPQVSSVEVGNVDNGVAQQESKGSSQNIIEMIISNPIYFGVTIVSVLVLVLLLWMVSRYNAQREEEFQAQNNVDDDFDDKSFDHNQEDYLVNSEEDLEETNDLLDETIDKVADKEPDEETQDILAEVNAYISYGRLDQATHVLEKAISQDPVRTDYRLKLLSIYKDMGDRKAFDRQFSELEAIQDASAIKTAEKIKDDFIEEESLELDTDLGLSNDKDEVEDDHLLDNQNDEFDSFDEELKSFDFDSVSLDEETDDLTTELDLSELDLASDDDASAAIVDEDEQLELADSLSLDEELDEISTNKASLESEDFDDSILDVDLEDLDLNAELDQETEISLDDQVKPQVEDLVVSDDILEEAAQAFEEESNNLDSNLAEGDDFDFLNGTDEASTKLDLARAYIDMGDIDGAKDILMEVTKEGSASQQAEAQDLLNSIS